jgi:hypothetical protein
VSTGSAESIAVSSLVAYDIYRKYINKNATGADILRVSRIAILMWGGLMGIFSYILLEMGLSLGWVYQFMGNAIGSAVPPLWFLLTWEKLPACGAISAAWGGLGIAMVLWFLTASMQCDDGGQPGQNPGCTKGISMDSLGSLNANLAGNLGALVGSTLICAFFGFTMPQNYEWSKLDEGLTMVEEDMTGLAEEDFSPDELLEAKSWIYFWGGGLSFFLVVIWPLLSIPAGVFTKEYFAFWVFVALAWAFIATGVIVVYPIMESADEISFITSSILGRKPKPVAAAVKE